MNPSANLEYQPSVTLPALVIPDVHEKYERAEKIIARHGGDCASIVFLGDYFDSHGQGDLAKTAGWLLSSLNDTRRTHLQGNHDQAYLFCSQDTYCSGWDETRQRVLEDVIADRMDAVRARMPLAVQAGPWVLSHAGFNSLCRDATPAQLVHWAERAHAALPRSGERGKMHLLNACGKVRGGTHPSGGVTWLDWTHEFKPLVGLHQIVGHTRGGNIRYRQINQESQLIAGEWNPRSIARGVTTAGMRSANWCLDAELKFWAIIHEDRMEIHSDDSVTVCEAPAALSGARPFSELADRRVMVEAGAEPPLYVARNDLCRLLGIESASSSLVEIEMHGDGRGLPVLREFIRRLPHHERHEAGPAPHAVNQSLRALRRKGLLPR